MLSKLSAVMGTIVAMALVIVALWGWGSAQRFAAWADNPPLALWAVRCAAVSAVAAAQVLGLTFLVDVVYAPGRGREALRLVAGFVCTISLVGAIALGLVSK